MKYVHACWLWPNRTIGKGESGQLREEHNAAVNKIEDLKTALRDVLGWYQSSDVAALMTKKGEQAEYHRTVTQARNALSGL